MTRTTNGSTGVNIATAAGQSQWYPNISVNNRSNVATQSVSYLSSPSGLTATPTGSGSTVYGYRVSALNAAGETLASAEVTCTNAAVLVTSSVYNTLAWSAVSGATGYNLYGRTPGGELRILTNFQFLSYQDDGSVTPSGALPTSNTAEVVTTVSAAPVELWVRLDGTTAVVATTDNYLVAPGQTRSFFNPTQPTEAAIGYTGSTTVSLISATACPYEIEFR
jgi:hypothetical protein